MLMSNGWFPRPVTMTLIDSCGQAESVMGGLWRRKNLSEMTEFRFSGPTGGGQVPLAHLSGTGRSSGSRIS